MINMKNHIVTGLIFLFSFISCNKLDSDKLVGTWDIISSLPEGIKSAEYVFDGEYLEIILFLQNGDSVREAIYEYFVEGDNISLINQEI